MRLTRHLKIFADYFQFVVMDEACEDDFGSIWTDEAFGRLLAVGETSVCPGTLRNVEVPVQIHVHPSAPEADLTSYDHAASASLSLPTGRLVVMGCTDHMPDALRIEVPAGSYRVLYLASGVESITTEWDPADDCYIVHLWPAPPCEPALLKHWRPGA